MGTTRHAEENIAPIDYDLEELGKKSPAELSKILQRMQDYNKRSQSQFQSSDSTPKNEFKLPTIGKRGQKADIEEDKGSKQANLMKPPKPNKSNKMLGSQRVERVEDLIESTNMPLKQKHKEFGKVPRYL